MKRCVILSEEEFVDLERVIITEIHEFSKKPYGFRMVSKESGEEIDDDMQVRGMLSHAIGAAFKRLEQGER